MPRYVRRNVYKLSPLEWGAYATALDNLKTAGDYDDIVETHQLAMNVKTDDPSDPGDPSGLVTDPRFKRNAAHRGPAFLPWHRQYLSHLEGMLPAGTTVPYWPWEQDETLADWSAAPVWTSAYLGSVDGVGQVQDGPFAAWQPRVYNSLTGTFSTAARPLERDFDTPNGYLPSQAQVDHALTYVDYDVTPWWTNSASTGFRNRLEGFLEIVGDPSAALSHMHNTVHIWVGGDMGPGTSPNDPVFFLHHCNVDRIWAKWQEARRIATGSSYEAAYQPQSGGPPGHNRGDSLFPWDGSAFPTRSIEDQLDLTAQQFVYDDVPIVTLTSATVDFGEVISGETAHAAAVFDVIAAFPVTFSLQSVSGPDAAFFGDPFAGTGLESRAVPDPVDLEATGYGWLAYTGESAPANRNATAVIRGELRDPVDDAVLWQRDFTVTVTASSIDRPSTAVSLVLDQSSSMSWASGFPGATRLDVLHFSAPPFVELLGSGNGLGIVAFDHDPHPRMPVTAMPGGEAAALGHIAAHSSNPAGATSIADGITQARADLGLPAVAATYDDMAVVVLTDGHETAPAWLADLPASAFGERIYAIGLGNESAIQPGALQTVVNGAGDGYLLLTGDLDAGTDTFLLSKYFLKILAGVRNDEIGRDPEGRVPIGTVVRVPFELSDADIAAEAILLTEHAVVDMAIEAPDGTVIDTALAGVLGGVEHVEGRTMQAYRLQLPLPLSPPAHHGTWHALLRLDPRRLRIWLRRRAAELAEAHAALVRGDLKGAGRRLVDEQLADEVEEIAGLGARYSFNVLLRSNLKMTGAVHQSGHDVGDPMTVRVRLTEYRQPVAGRARASALVRRPDGSDTLLALTEVEPGTFEAVVTGGQHGVWRFQVRADGETLFGRRFEREDLLSAWIRDPARPPGRPGRSGAGGGGDGSGPMCAAARCLLSDRGIREWLAERGVDVDTLRSCLDEACHDDG